MIMIKNNKGKTTKERERNVAEAETYCPLLIIMLSFGERNERTWKGNGNREWKPIAFQVILKLHVIFSISTLN